jgi:Family of unknown function (DUF5330)
MMGRVMFFLLRMAFWLGVVCVLLPSGGATSSDKSLDTSGAVSAATAAVSDMAGFCNRQPDACVVGGKVAVAIGQKAEAGARTLIDMISTKISEKTHSEKTPNETTGSMAGQKPVAARGTLTPNDLAPTWHAPVPLPPRREAQAGGPSV